MSEKIVQQPTITNVGLTDYPYVKKMKFSK